MAKKFERIIKITIKIETDQGNIIEKDIDPDNSLLSDVGFAMRNEKCPIKAILALTHIGIVHIREHRIAYMNAFEE